MAEKIVLVERFLTVNGLWYALPFNVGDTMLYFFLYSYCGERVQCSL